MDQSSQQNASTHSDDGNHDPGKMFVGGLSWETSTDGLRKYFCQFGDIKECVIMREPTSKRSRGFGFVTFSDPANVEKVIQKGIHEVDKKKVDPKVAFPKRSHPKPVVKTKKIFVGGIAASTTEAQLKKFFEKYGKVEEAHLMFDRVTNKHRGFGFVIFDNEKTVENLCNEDHHFYELDGKLVEVKKAQPKEVMMPQNQAKNRAAMMRNLYGLYDPNSTEASLLELRILQAQHQTNNNNSPSIIPSGLNNSVPIIMDTVGNVVGNVKGYAAPNFAALSHLGRGAYTYAPFPHFFSGFTSYPPGIMMQAAGVPPTLDRRGQQTVTYSYPDYGSAGPAGGRTAPPQPPARSEPNSHPQPQQPDYGRDYHQQVMPNSYQPQSYAPSPSPVSNRFNTTNSPGPIDIYGSSQDQGLGGNYVATPSPQPTHGFGIGGQPGLMASYHSIHNGY